MSDKSFRSLLCARIVALGTLFWFLSALPKLTDADHGICFMIYMFLTTPIIVLIWMVITIISWSKIRFRQMWWWVGVPLACLLSVMLLRYDLGFEARIGLSKGPLTKYVADLQSGIAPATTPGWIGWLWIEKTTEHNGVILFWMNRGFLNQRGVAFVPLGKEPPARINLIHIDDNWHIFEWRF